MSVISTFEATPSRLKLLYAFLEGRTEERARLIAITGPRALSRDAESDDGVTTVENSIAEALQMGLLIENDGRLSVRPIEGKRVLGFDRAFVDLIEWLLLSADSPGVESQRAFPLALSWLLIQPPRKPLNFSTNQVTRLREQLGDSADYQLTNASSWQNLCYWARVLGYCGFVGLGGKTLIIPDPTLALGRHLKTFLPSQGAMRIADVALNLAERCPVFEGGGARNEVEARLLNDSREQFRFSESSSFALLRLEAQGKIQLQILADADARILNLGDKTRRVTHIKRTKAL